MVHSGKRLMRIGRRRRMGPVTAVAVIAIGWATLSAPMLAHAQSSDAGALIQRLERLENEIQTLSRQVYRGGEAGGQSDSGPVSLGQTQPSTGGGGSTGDIIVRLDRMEEQIRSLRGEVETQTNRVNQVSTRLERFAEDVEDRLNDLEQQGTAAAPDTPSDLPPGDVAEEAPAEDPPAEQQAGTSAESRDTGPQALGTLPAGEAGDGNGAAETQTAAAPSVLPEADPRNQYDYAFNLIRQSEFGEAETAFREFLSLHDDHALAENARYWLAETYYVRGDYREAAVEFAEGYQQYSEGAKAPDNLLKLGMALARLGETEDACLALSEVGNEFPDAPSNITRRAQQEMSELGC